MTRHTLHVLLVTGLVFLAGCAGGLSASPGSPTSDANQGSATPAPTAGDGTVAFYVSDEQNDIDDFRHLNVTVSCVGFQRAGGDGDGTGGWVERDVDGVTVDLTELQGAKATLVDEYDVPNGTYNKVFVHVEEVEGTLKGGESVRVKLPSGKLQVNKGFTVGSGSSVEFVFDITVHRAGKSGKYILKPVVGESGSDVPIERVDDDDDRRDGVAARFVGDVSPGENATVRVTQRGSAVENATVVVNGDIAGTTGESGEIEFEVPDADSLTVTVEADDWEVELEREFESSEDGDE